jgi:hypothetical protein
VNTPVRLAEEIVKQMGDADHDTAVTALDIARLLVDHRERGAIHFNASTVRELSEDSHSTP